MFGVPSRITLNHRHGARRHRREERPTQPTDGELHPPPPVRDVPARREPFNLPPWAGAVNEWPGGADLGAAPFNTPACFAANGTGNPWANRVPATKTLDLHCDDAA